MDALFDLPAPPRPAPPPARETPPLPTPDLPLSCRWRGCRGPLTGWCRAVDALPETGSWSAADRIIAAVHAERDRTREAQAA